jgi:hypothetical protein
LEDVRHLDQNSGHCFPSGTPILLPSGAHRPIDSLRPGDTVLSFDPAAFNGRGGLVEKRVTRLFGNVTDTWIVLSWVENGERRELTVTPGHRFLDAKGGFRPIEEILQTDATIILEDGGEARVTGEVIHYSEETARLYEQAEGMVSQSIGGLALAPEVRKGWQDCDSKLAA